jgi:hypothetical protein
MRRSTVADALVFVHRVDEHHPHDVRAIARREPANDELTVRLADEHVRWSDVQTLVGPSGVPRQTEEYSDWKTDVPLAPARFAPVTWRPLRTGLQRRVRHADRDRRGVEEPCRLDDCVVIHRTRR